MPSPQSLSVTGHGAIAAVKLSDEVENAPVVTWERVGIDQFDYHKDGNALQIGQVTIGAPYARFQVAKDQTTNFSHILVSHAPASATPPQPQSAGAAPQMTVAIGKIVVERGAADYADDSLPLPFAAHITDLTGEATTLATATTAPAALNLQGQVGEFGEVKIAGALTSFDPTQSTTIDVRFRNVEFPGLSPYTVKFAGRRIAKGKLDIGLRYAIDRGRLNGANRVVIRNIELGEKVDVPGAMNLPLGLAVAVLKDRDGKIDVDLPVSGDLHDPKFGIGAVIWRVIGNLLTNIVTSPFQALAGLVGGESEKLGRIMFDPGQAELGPPEKEKVQSLAKALSMRPNLVLVVPGAVDPQADRTSLQRRALEAAMTKELGNESSVSRQRRFLESEFKDRIGRDQLDPLEAQYTHPPAGQPGSRPVLDEPAYVSALRERVAKALPVADADLDGLAQSRAAVVTAALKQVPGLDPQRVKTGAIEKTKADEEGLIPLKLQAESASGE
jgi:hypothetical protein